MAKYSADIEIAVRGGQQLNNTIKSLNRLNNSINVINRNAKLLEGKGFNVASIENYSRAVSKAERAVRKAAEGTNQERQAITALVSAMELENRARQRKNILIAREIANQRRVIATANAGVGIQGPALPGYMMRGPSSPIGGGRGGRGAGAGGGGSRLGGAISGSIIGGAFPLLFGQGAGAAAGGAVGGLVGGLAGPGGSFAGSLLGTLLGGIASKGKAVQDLAEDMGLAAEQTKQLAAAFQAAGADADKFGAAVQTIRGIGFAEGTEIEAIKLVSRLTEEYGGKIDKVAAAYGNFVAKGKVGIADINKFTAQGIPILDALEKRYGKTRDEILGMAKDGKITAQALSDALQDIANRSDNVTKKVTSNWEQTWKNIQTGASTSVNAFAIIFGRLIGVSSDITGNIAQFFSKLYVDIINGAVNAAANIANALASAANNIAAFYKANPLAIGPLRDAAVTGLENFKTGARATAKDLQNLVKAQSATAGAVGAISVPGQAPPSGGGGGGGRSAANKADDDRKREAKRVADLIRNEQFITKQKGVQTKFAQLIFEAEQAADPVRARQLQTAQELVLAGNETAKLLEEEVNGEARLAIARTRQAEMEGIRQEGLQAVLKLQIDQQKAHEQILYGLETELALAMALTNEERNRIELEAERLRLTEDGMSEEQIAQILEKKSLLNAPGMQVKMFIAETSRQLNDLEAVAINVSQGIGNAVGNSIANGITGLIEGTATAKEVFASFLRDVGQLLVQEGTKMIAMYIAIGIAKIFAGFSGGGGNIGSPEANLQKYAPLAKGGTFANGVATFANGGAFTNSIVSSPTLFKFADGGTTRTGLMGEAGPEAIMPLKRGADGSLGVQANGLRDAMDRDRSSANNGAPVLNMSFQSTNINGVEYVSRDQLEQAMAETRRQASRDGAQRGMTMTLDKLQQSPSTRSRVGMR